MSVLKEVVRKYLENHIDKSPSELARLIKTESKLDASEGTIRTTIYRVKKEIDIPITEGQKWEVKNNNYHWEALRGHISMSVDQIDQLFYEYSEHGQNLTQTQIINRHQLKVWEWNSIKSTLQLFKKSNIFSPHTVEITPPEELTKMIQSKIAKMLSNVGERVETIYNQELNRAYKKAITEIEEWEVRRKIILTELADIVPKLTVELKPVLKINQDADGILSVFIADVHFGAESRTKSIQPYSPEITVAQFEEIAEQVNKLNAKEVHLFFVGDNIESATGLNHIDSWKGLAKGYYGSQLMIRAYKAYVKFISTIHNVKKVYAVPGNHDRMTPSNKDDGQGFLAEILFEMISLAFNGKLDVMYDEKVITVSIDNLHYIMSHGHLKLSDINPAELILEYGDQYKFNVVVSAHWHNRKVRKDHRNFRQLVCPSIFPGNDYSENLGVSSAPGFLMITNKNNKPLVYDYPL
jgi:Calcineurin-like phosphoesterase